jgi:hypothetical protein
MSQRMGLSIASQFSNNALFILDGLTSGEFQTAERLRRELDDLAQHQSTPTVDYVKVATRDHVLVVLDQIEQECENKAVKPIVHIEAHGDEASGLVIGEQHERVPWPELSSAIQRINIATQNNTGLVLATCYGIQAIKPMTFLAPAPFYFLIGSQSKVSAALIDDEMKRFYQCLYATGSLTDAMLLVDEAFQQFHADRFFCKLMAEYFQTGCMGKAAIQRRERLISEAVKSGASADHQNLRQMRKSVKAATKPSQGIFDRYANIFLHGRHNIDYETFIEFVRSAKVQ